MDGVSIAGGLSLSLALTDDFYMIDEESNDIATDTGKSLRFSSGDNGWCTACTVYLLVSSRFGGMYNFNVRALSKKDQLLDMVSLQKTFGALKGEECLQYTVKQQSNDIVLSIMNHAGQGEITIQ